MTMVRIAKKQITRVGESMRALCLLMITVLFGLMLSSECVDYVKEGMRLAVGCVIPSSFPFMIITDWYVAYGRPENLRTAGKVFSGVFGFSPMALGAFICGNVGGFPIGAKMCAEAYESGELSKAEAERLMPLSNNPSCAFVIGGVGIGMWEDARIGFLLLASVMASTLTCSVILRQKYAKCDIIRDKTRQSYSFVNSVKSSGMSCVGIISFISIFSVAAGIIKKRVKNAHLSVFIYSFLEVTNAVNTASEISAFPPTLRLAICGFALGFGGICVGMQSALFASRAGLGMRKYYLIKLLEGVLSASYATLFFNL